jgi:hypothetical protein
MDRVKRQVHFEQAALEATLTDYFHEVEHAAARIERLEINFGRLRERWSTPS